MQASHVNKHHLISLPSVRQVPLEKLSTVFCSADAILMAKTRKIRQHCHLCRHRPSCQTFVMEMIQEENSYIFLPKHIHTLHLCRQLCYYLMAGGCSMPDHLSWNAHGKCLDTQCSAPCWSQELHCACVGWGKKRRAARWANEVPSKLIRSQLWCLFPSLHASSKAKAVPHAEHIVHNANQSPSLWHYIRKTSVYIHTASIKANILISPHNYSK